MKALVLALFLIIVCITHVDMFQRSSYLRYHNSHGLGPISSSSYVSDHVRRQNGDLYFEGENGEILVIHANENADEKLIADYASDANNTRYYLYTRSNPLKPQRLLPNSTQSVLNSNYRSDKVTIFLAHGWRGSYQAEINTILTEAFLAQSDVNVICVDWSYVAQSMLYETVKEATPIAGVIVGEFIKWMIGKEFAVFDKLHLVGFSLGGHLVGNAGRKNKGLIARITGLDPAGPSWTDDKRRLNRKDAEYVEVIHTNSILCTNWICKSLTGLGIEEPSGDTDFYPNGGHSQPGCQSLYTFSNNFGCSHRYAVYLMGSSIKYNKFEADRCAGLKAAQNDYCSGSTGYMGHTELKKPIRGIFRLDTQQYYPYYI